MLPPIVKSIEVACAQKEAFEIFLEGMADWWPAKRFSVSAFYGKSPKSIRVEAKPGGKIIEVAHNGSEHLWGTIKAYTPYSFMSMDFHIAQPASFGSLLELEFEALTPSRTRVKLTHSNWEAFGNQAKMMYGGYETGWSVIFDQAYKKACDSNSK